MSDSPINIVDIVFIVILLLSGLLSFYKGIVQEVLRIASWVGASFVSLYLYYPTIPFVKQYVTNDLTVSIITGGGLFIVSLVIFYIVSSQISGAVKSSSIGALNKSLGFLFGLGRGLIITSVFYVTLGSLMNGNLPDTIKTAKTESLLRSTADVLVVLLPERIEETVTNTLNNLKTNAENTQNIKQTYDMLNTPKLEDDIGDLIDDYIDQTQ